MRRLILVCLMTTIAGPLPILAQTREIRKDERKVDSQHSELQDAIESGNAREIEHQAKDERKARDELREDRNHYARHHYEAPYKNWNYTAVLPGSQLDSRFYDSRYYVSHPASYELRRAAHNERWVRYGDDLVLVNTRNGQVVEVASGRF